MDLKPTWRDIFLFCTDQQIAVLPPAKSEWHDLLRSHTYVHDLLDVLATVEAPHEEEIDWAINEWRDTGDWPSVSENTRFLLRLRFGSAARFSAIHARPETGVTILPVPDLSIREICSWLVTDWWGWHGRKECAVEWTMKLERIDEEN